jgi:lactate dehydrogenase-like 2-hydroxyacid dehydrogenase
MRRLDDACDVDVHDGSELSEEQLIARLQGRQGILSIFTSPLTRRVIEASPTLEVIANVAVGYNNIDLVAAREHGVVVTNTPDVLTEATANLTWTLILDCTRRVSEGDRLVRRGGWKGWTFDFMLGSDLAGKQLGVVGMGRIGRAVARRARAFDMRVACFSPNAVKRGADPPPGSSDARRATGVDPVAEAEAMPFDRLLATSDVVTLHCPLTDATRHLIDQKALARMKRSAYLINASRGPVVDEAALAWALKNRMISGAALDVYEREPVVHAELLALENVVLAPHLGSSTRETRVAMADLAARNAIAVMNGEPALTPVPGL